MFAKLKHLYRVHLSKKHEQDKTEKRSSKWPAVEHAHRLIEPACVACGSAEHLQVHHKKPFHLHPELELDQSNLVSLCMSPNECHLRLGHGDNFKAYNPNVMADCAAMKTAVSADAKAALWVKAKAARLMA